MSANTSGGKVEHNHSFTQYTVSLAPQYIYNIYNKKQLKFFMGTGLSFNWSQYQHNISTTNRYSSSGVSTTYPAVKLEPYWWSVPVKAGIILKRNYGITVAYLQPLIPITNYVYYKVNNRMMQVSFSYFLNKSASK
nr:outer membrane beta-barrel protein [Pedobacter sp. BS3]